MLCYVSALSLSYRYIYSFYSVWLSNRSLLCYFMFCVKCEHDNKAHTHRHTLRKIDRARKRGRKNQQIVKVNFANHLNDRSIRQIQLDINLFYGAKFHSKQFPSRQFCARSIDIDRLKERFMFSSILWSHKIFCATLFFQCNSQSA